MGDYGFVRMSREFSTVQEAVDFINTVDDVFTTFVVPDVRTNSEGRIYTKFFVIYYTPKEKD